MSTSQLSTDDWRRVLSIVVREKALPNAHRRLVMLRLLILPLIAYLITRSITNPADVSFKSFILLDLILLFAGEVIANFILVKIEQTRQTKAIQHLNPNFNLTNENTQLLDSDNFYILVHTETKKKAQIIPIEKSHADLPVWPTMESFSEYIKQQ